MSREAACAVKRKIAAILAADVAGYSRLVAEDEEETLRRLANYRAVIDDLIGRFGGRIFNTAGDAVLAEFQSAVDAVRCALDIQESLRARNAAYPQSRHMTFRIGITIADVVERDGDLLGDGVNIAARLQGLAPVGGIYVSRPVYEAVANKVSVQFADRGPQQLKNISQRVHAYMLIADARAAPSPALRAIPALLRSKWGALGLVGVLAAGASATYLTMKAPIGPRPQEAARPAAAAPDRADEKRVAADPARPPNAAPSLPKVENAKPAPSPSPTPAGARPPEGDVVARVDPDVRPHGAKSDGPATGPTSATPAPPPRDAPASDAVHKGYWRDCRIAESSDNLQEVVTACRGLVDTQSASGDELARVEYTLARALRELGRVDDAIAAYTRAISIKPTAESYNHRGIAFYDKGVFNSAVADYSEAIRLDAQNGEGFNNRAWTQFKAGKSRAALADADKAVQLLPSEAYAWDTRAHIHEALGNRSAAVRDFRKALALDPGSVASKEGLGRLGAGP
jgi:class 3 adenylate cyclase